MNQRTIRRICKEVYEHVGKGCSEASYQRALEYELMRCYNVCVIREYYLNKMYKGICVSNMRADLIVTDWDLLIEVKAVANFSRKDLLQAEQYKSISNMNVVLVNFGHSELQIKFL